MGKHFERFYRKSVDENAGAGGPERGKSSVLIRLPRFAKMRIFYENVIRVRPLDNLYPTPQLS